MRRSATAGVTVSLMMLGALTPAVALEGRPGTGMLVIGHRGAPVYTTESSQLSYEMASNVQADMLEGDLVMSKDGRLVVCHDIDLSRVTDIATRPEFAQGVRNFNGVDYGGWWVDDFTWDQLATLRKPNGQSLMLLDDLISLAQARGETLYIEIKESQYFASRGMDITGALITLMGARGMAGPATPFWVQSDNPEDLTRIKTMTGNRTVFLTRSVGQEDVPLFPSYRQFADVLGVPTTRARRNLVAQAHAADLGVHIWTLRGSRDAYRKAASIGADGVITDFPDLGVDVRSRARQTNRPAGLTTRLENGNVIATWTADPGVWYAVTFDFGDPLLAPTLWLQGGSASYPMADAKNVDVTVSRFDGARMSADAFSHIGVESVAYDAPSVRTRVASMAAEVFTDGKTRLTGTFERLRGKKWVPLRNESGWLRARGEDVEDLRRNFRTNKKGEFSVTVQVREDIVSGYVPERAWRVGVTASSTLKPSASKWVTTAEGAAPERVSLGQAKDMPKADVKVRG